MEELGAPDHSETQGKQGRMSADEHLARLRKQTMRGTSLMCSMSECEWSPYFSVNSRV